jgi:uncharacterized protein YjbJ (UPF0337 family)
MTGNADEMRGRAKEAAGDLTGDERLKREGQVDRATGKVKRAAERVKEGVDDVPAGTWMDR